MPRIVPSSSITLYSGIQITGGMNIAFASRAAQQAYFNKHIQVRSIDCTYIRKTGRIKVETLASVVNSCNFISFRNPLFENREFYARITNWEYVNNVMVEISYTIDYWQSYMFDISYLRGTVEREHLSVSDFNKAEANPWDLSIYEFNTKENLPYGTELEPNYTVGQNFELWGPNGDPWIIVQVSSFDTDAVPLNNLIGLSSMMFTPNNEVWVNGIKTDLVLKLPHAYYTFVTQISRLQPMINYLTQQGLAAEIIGVYMANSDIITSYLEINGDSIPDTSMEIVNMNFVKTNFRNKKLCLHPYQYLRVVSPSNDAKEYKYERFMSNRRMYIALCLDGVNTISAIPYGYREFKEGGSNLENLNYNERLDFNNIAQIGYSSDAFLAYVSNQYAKTIENRSISVSSAMQGKLQTAENYGSEKPEGILGRLGHALRAAEGSNVLDTVGQLLTGNITGAAETARGDVLNSLQQQYADIHRSSDVNTATPYDIYKDAYAADEYHAGDSNGMLDSYFSLSGGKIYQFQVYYVSLLPDIMQKYDNYFSYYGYNSQRCGVPRVINYVHQTGDQPHFDDLDGLYKTYVKTASIRVTGVPESVSGYIENIFNSGCLFLKGESLS